MQNLTARLLDYRPDPRMLRAKFRAWHVEALLNQAAELIDKCLGELREYCSLEYSWNQFSIDLEAELRDLELDNAHTSDFERDLLTAQIRKVFFDDPQGHLPDSLQAAQKLFALRDGSGQGANGWIEAHQALAEKNIEINSRAMDKSLNDLRLGWGQSDADYFIKRLKRRTQTAEKKRDNSTEGRSLDLAAQRDLVLSRLTRNYEDALNRASVAEEGLATYYGHSPGVSLLSDPGLTVVAKVSNLAIWIRNSIEWLVAYQQLDQAFTRVISIRSQLTREIWTKFQTAIDRIVVAVPIPADLFMGHDNVRMRGIGASLLGATGQVPWSIAVRLPRVALYQREGASAEVNQETLPSCLLGRVENRTSARPLEITGLISLMNASPIGKPTPEGAWLPWWLEVIRPVGTAEGFSKIDNVLLEINAVGRPRAN